MTGFPALANLGDWAETLAHAGLAAAVAIGIALTIHLALFALLDRIARASASPADDALFDGLRHPARWSLVAVAIGIAAEASAPLAQIWGAVGRFIVPALLGWTAFALVRALAAVIELRAEGHADETVARSRRTRIAILSRTVGFVIVVITIALMLFNVPAVRTVGATLLASAGLATLAVGAAAQPALKSLIAGLQMALTEPIRIGDLVVIDGHSGRVEDIRMSYVIIRTGDERRVVVPTSRFLDQTFENWTRVSGGLTGSVLLPVKPGFAIEPVRAAYLAALDGHADWDRRAGTLQVADARVGSVELKLVMSAADPAALDRLRLAMREAMLEWLRETMPDALCDEV